MSQALVNEVRSLRARVVALEEHLRALEANIEAHYQRKRGPKPRNTDSFIPQPIKLADGSYVTHEGESTLSPTAPERGLEV